MCRAERTCSIQLDLEHESAALRVVRRGVLTEGPETEELEEAFAHWLGVERGRVVAVSSGTAALTALLIANDIGPGSVVAVPAFTFTATALAVLRAGAMPYFVDVNSVWSLSVSSLRTAMESEEEIDAVIGVDLHGIPADWRGIERATVPTTLLFEDACPAYGARYRGALAGTLGRDGAAFSLNESKQLPGGEGGLVVAPDEGTAEIVRALRAFGERPGDRRFSSRRSFLAGDNWKITEMSAALALASLPRLNERIAKAKYAGKAIADAIPTGHPHLSRLGWTPDSEPSWMKIRLTARDEATAGRLEGYLKFKGVPIRTGEVDPLPEHPIFKGYPKTPTPNAAQSARSFVIGSRSEPVFDASPATADRWAEVLNSLPIEVSPK